MKIALLATASLLAVAPATFAQVKSQEQCRPLVKNDFLDTTEYLVGSGPNTQVCHAVRAPRVSAVSFDPGASAPAQVASAAAPAGNSAVSSTAVSEAAAQTPVASSDDQTAATILFYRPKHLAGMALKPPVFVDDNREGRLHNGDNLKVSVAPGSHQVYSSDKASAVAIDAKAGQTYYVKLDVQFGLLKGHGAVTVVDAQQAQSEIKSNR